MNKGIYIILVFTLGMIIAGCTTTRMTPSAVPTIIAAEPTLELSAAPTNQPTDQPVTPTALISPDPEPSATLQNAAGDGKELVESVCIICHSLDRVSNSHKSRTEWEVTVKRMVDHGAPLDDAQQISVIEYLSATYN